MKRCSWHAIVNWRTAPPAKLSIRHCSRRAAAGSTLCTQHRKMVVAQVCRDLLEGRSHLEGIDSKE